MAHIAKKTESTERIASLSIHYDLVLWILSPSAFRHHTEAHEPFPPLLSAGSTGGPDHNPPLRPVRGSPTLNPLCKRLLQRAKRLINASEALACNTKRAAPTPASPPHDDFGKVFQRGATDGD